MLSLLPSSLHARASRMEGHYPLFTDKFLVSMAAIQAQPYPVGLVAEIRGCELGARNQSFGPTYAEFSEHSKICRPKSLKAWWCGAIGSE
jgi:hypothetical protein